MTAMGEEDFIDSRPQHFTRISSIMRILTFFDGRYDDFGQISWFHKGQIRMENDVDTTSFKGHYVVIIHQVAAKMLR